MKTRRPIKVKIYARAVIAIILITVWSVTGLTGLLLWLAPSGQRSGQIPLLFELTKEGWGDIHFWLSISALIVTIVHIILDWRALVAVIRYLTSLHRSPKMPE